MLIKLNINMSYFGSFINSPVGPKTIFFWAPMFNWGFVLAPFLDSKKKPEEISGRMLISK